MRIWSLHPKYLDRLGLVACWRETLLAQKVLKGETIGYQNHPQLTRFRSCPDAAAAIGTYLDALANEAERRGYTFNREKINPARMPGTIPVTRGQIRFEWEHLKHKLTRRDPLWLANLSVVELPDTHPLFRAEQGEVESWEKGR